MPKGLHFIGWKLSLHGKPHDLMLIKYDIYPVYMGFILDGNQIHANFQSSHFRNAINSNDITTD